MVFVNKIKQLFLKKKSYQEKRSGDENWRLMKPYLNAQESVLDVACDAGFYSIKCAKQGCFVIGVDILEGSLNKAIKNAKDDHLNNAIFGRLSLSPHNIKLLPKFDTVLCLSVYHHFVREFGEGVAKSMLVDLFSRANQQMLLQIPSKIGKYTKEFSVNFNGDESIVRDYVCSIFADLSDCDILYLGKKIEKPPAEEFRYLYLIKRTG